MKSQKGLKQMQLLNHLEYRFDKEPLRVKIELYLIPLLLFILYLSFDDPIKKSKSFSDTTINTLNVVDVKTIDILKDMESFLERKNIEVESISNTKNSIDFILDINEKKLFEFLEYIENYNNYSKIENLELNENQLSISVSFKNFYVKEKIKLFEKVEQITVVENKEFKLLAIIDESVFINNKWFEIGDKIDSFHRLESIKKNSVIITNGSKSLKLELFKNENL